MFPVVVDDFLPASSFAEVSALVGSAAKVDDEADASGLLRPEDEAALDARVAAEARAPLRVHARFVVTLGNRATNGIHRDADPFSACLYLAPEWELNWGGDLLIVSRDRTTIRRAVEYRPNRLVIFDDNVFHVVRPPTPNTDRQRVTLITRYRREDGGL